MTFIYVIRIVCAALSTAASLRPALLLIMSGFVFVQLATAQGKRPSQPAVQTGFGTETPIKRPVRIPKDVLDQLLEENGEQLARCEEGSGRHLASSKYFIASSIDINGDRLSDLVVQADDIVYRALTTRDFGYSPELAKDLNLAMN